MSESFNSDVLQPALTDEQCAWWLVHGAQPHVNSDISGIGVVVAFVLSAYITTGLAIAAYVLGAIDINVLGPVDLLVHRIPTQSRISPAWREALQQCILLFSDQQIMTGIAILVAGFVGLAGVMDVYHFQIVIMLAWMSSSVNLTALTVLGRYFEEHKEVFMWRLAGMLVLLILLLVALVPTASVHWAMWLTEEGDPKETSGWAIPADCFFMREWGHGFSPDAPFSYVLLIVSYVWKIGSVSKVTRSLFLRRIREPAEKYFESLIRKETQARDPVVRQPRSWKYRIYLVLYIDILVLFEFAASFAASLWLSALGLLYATTEIGHGDAEKTESETVVVSLPAEPEVFTSLTQQRMIIFSSRIFAVLIAVTHLCLLTFSILTFYVNALSIGFEVTHDYIWLLLGIAIYIGALFAVTVVSIPLSKIFR